MEEWIRSAFESSELGAAMLPAAAGLGLLTALGSCCNFAVWAAVAGYAASRGETRPRDAVVVPICFVLGASVFMGLVGAGIGCVGQMIGSTFRFYGTLAAGLAAVVFGLLALDLVPFKLPVPALKSRSLPRGFWGTCLFGAVVGGTSMACSIYCGPGLAVVLGLAAASRQGLWGAGILASFGLGFGLPFAAAMLGLSLGRSAEIARRAARPIQLVAGAILVLAGFWMLHSIA
jgi:cytochrome c biogenesis protein CcdA